jgi:homoserine O-acetyltransferase
MSGTPLGIRLVTAALLALGACRAPQPKTAAAPTAPLRDPTSLFWQQAAPARSRVRIETTQGTFVVELVRDWAPIGTDHFYNLVRAGFFDDSRFFRVIPRFIAQFGIPGDPTITAIWKDRAIRDDSVRTSNVRGTLVYAMTGPNTRTTQLYVNLVDNARLDAQGFSPIGRVVDGMDVVDKLYGGYGENAGGGVRAGKQAAMLTGGNAHLDSAFPKLDHLNRAVIER